MSGSETGNCAGRGLALACELAKLGQGSGKAPPSVAPLARSCPVLCCAHYGRVLLHILRLCSSAQYGGRPASEGGGGRHFSSSAHQGGKGQQQAAQKQRSGVHFGPSWMERLSCLPAPSQHQYDQLFCLSLPALPIFGFSFLPDHLVSASAFLPLPFCCSMFTLCF